ncbi:sugar-binding domain-containing protein [Microbacterium sp. BWR-S6Y]|uniref:sugar-binding transcriptional regulator n=1 Tax=Microbacterium sp. BWR-S6Y TaxID=3232073 RepID=UPI00352721D8
MAPLAKDSSSTRAMTKVAHLYYRRGLVQTEIAEEMGLSQAGVSRLLTAAGEHGIARTIVIPPSGFHNDLEQAVEETFGLREVHIVETTAGDDVVPALARALVPVLQLAPIDGRTIGLTSWSRALQAAVDVLPDLPRANAGHIVELLGDVGRPSLQHRAALTTERFARATGGDPVFLRAPGVVSTAAMRAALLDGDPHARRALAAMDHLDLALVGIGEVRAAAPLSPGENFFTDAQFAGARAQGAVGEIGLRFLDAYGEPVASDLGELVLGMELDQLRTAGRRIAVAGGRRKHAAVLAAVRGHWIDVLVTDETTARHLVASGVDTGSIAS